MACLQKSFTVRTESHQQVVDISAQVAAVVAEAGITTGLCLVFVPHATAAITVNENADPNIGVDFLRALKKMVIEHDDWLHDRVDNNAAAHIKAALIGPSETLPISNGRLALGTWQDIFVCEFDGPRTRREVSVTVWG